MNDKAILPPDARATALYHNGISRPIPVFLLPSEVGGDAGYRWRDISGWVPPTLKGKFHTVEEGVAAARRNGKFTAVLRVNALKAAA